MNQQSTQVLELGMDIMTNDEDTTMTRDEDTIRQQQGYDDEDTTTRIQDVKDTKRIRN